MISTVFAFSACSDDDDDKAPVNPVSNAKVPETAEIGGTFVITGTGFTDSGIALYLEDAEKERTKLEASFSASGATCIVPKSVTETSFEVILTQNGNEWKLGTINIIMGPNPITTPSVPAEALIGEDLVLGGVGYNDSSKIYLENEAEERKELEITNRQNDGLTCSITNEISTGNYKVILTQDGGEWVLSENIFITKLKKVKKIALFEKYYEQLYETRSYELSWANNTPTKFTVHNEMNEYAPIVDYNIESRNEQIIAQTDNEDADIVEFTLTLNGNKVAKTEAIDYRNRNYTREWQYTSEYLNSLYDVSRGMRVKYEYNDENILNIELNGNNPEGTYTYKEKEYNHYGIDWAACYAILNSFEYPDWSFAVLTNMGGKKSAYLPEKLIPLEEGVGVKDIEFIYSFDEDGYLSKVEWTALGDIMMYVTFEYED